MKPLIIYHANCTDGYGAAFAAWMKFGDDAEYKPMNYGDKDFSHPSDIRENVLDRDVYILDFSFPKSVMDQIMVDAARVVWLDHHKTAFEMWCGEYTKGMTFFDEAPYALGHPNNNIIRLDDNRSGALLAWEYFHPGTEVPMLIQHIDDRDRWVFALEGSKAVHAALQLRQPWRFEQWRLMVDYWEHGALPYGPNLVSEGSTILRAQEVMVDQQVKQAMPCIIRRIIEKGNFGAALYERGESFSGLALNTQNHISETGHVLANKSGTYGLLWYVAADGKVKCSLRSNGDYDVSAIAKTFGGGGHRNAAGFETDINTLMGWLE